MIVDQAMNRVPTDNDILVVGIQVVVYWLQYRDDPGGDI